MPSARNFRGLLQWDILLNVLIVMLFVIFCRSLYRLHHHPEIVGSEPPDVTKVAKLSTDSHTPTQTIPKDNSVGKTDTTVQTPTNGSSSLGGNLTVVQSASASTQTVPVSHPLSAQIQSPGSDVVPISVSAEITVPVAGMPIHLKAAL